VRVDTSAQKGPAGDDAAARASVMLDVEAVADRVALTPAWVNMLVRAGRFPRPTGRGRWRADQVDIWARHDALTHREPRPLTPFALRVVALRLLPLSAASIAARLGVRRGVIEEMLIVAGLDRVRGLDDGLIDAWLQGRRRGQTDDRLARNAHAGRSTFHLAVDGYPPVEGNALAPILARQLERRWRQGQGKSDLERVARTTWRRITHPASGVVLEGERWTSPRITDFLGWSDGRIYQRPRGMPEPDGRHGGHAWWWKQTIVEWAESLEACPDCGARVARLSHHRWIHRRGRTQSAVQANSVSG
jgi:hypothetical protein